MARTLIECITCRFDDAPRTCTVCHSTGQPAIPFTEIFTVETAKDMLIDELRERVEAMTFKDHVNTRSAFQQQKMISDQQKIMEKMQKQQYTSSDGSGINITTTSTTGYLE